MRTVFEWSGMRLYGERNNKVPLAHTLYLYEEGSWQPLARVDSYRGGSVPQQRVLYYHSQPNGFAPCLTNGEGEIVWRGRMHLWGTLRTEENRESYSMHPAHNLRFAGQYLDRETGLHYNTFRYYAPESGRFTQLDPIGLQGGINLYQYAPNPLSWIDPLGLTPVDATGYSVYGLFDPGAKEPYYVGITDDPIRRAGEHRGTGRLTPGSEMVILDDNVKYGQARGYEQYYIEKYKTRIGIIGEDISATNRGNKYNSFDHGRTDPRAQAFKDAYNSKKDSSGGRKCG